MMWLLDLLFHAGGDDDAVVGSPEFQGRMDDMERRLRDLAQQVDVVTRSSDREGAERNAVRDAERDQDRDIDRDLTRDGERDIVRDSQRDLQKDGP